jgi:hypothetical protein
MITPQRISRITVAVAGIMVASASRCIAQEVPALMFRIIARYGAVDSNGTVPPDSPASLGAISGMAEGRAGSIYVADPTAHHVVVFERNGAVRQTLGREGAGPGEFRAMSDLAAGSDGSVYVWDGQLRRMTHFAPDGRLLSETPMSPSLATDMTITSGRAWFVQLRLNHGCAVKAFDLATGAAVDSFAPLTSAELTLDRAGNPGAITHNGTGDIVYAGPIPIVLRLWAHQVEREQGAPLRSDIATVTTGPEHVTMARASLRGIAPLASGGYAVVYGLADSTDGKTGRPIERYWLGRLDAGGRLAARAALPVGSAAPRLAPTASGDLLVSLPLDEPQVWRIRLSSK